MTWLPTDLRAGSRGRFRPQLEALEDRRLLAVGTFVEDFVSDLDPTQVGFDSPFDSDPATPPDELHIQSDLPEPIQTFPDRMVGDFGDRYSGMWVVSEPALPTPWDTSYALFLISHGTPGTQPAQARFEFLGVTSDEEVAEVSVTVEGRGSIVFLGKGSRKVTRPIDTTAGDAQLITVDRGFAADGDGRELGGIKAVRFISDLALAIDDLTVVVRKRNPTNGGNVRVTALGNYLGIIGDNKDNRINVYLMNSDTGAVLVEGLAGTTVNGAAAVTVNLLGIGDAGYELPNVFVTMNGGDDSVKIERPNLAVSFPLADLLVDLGSGDNDVDVLAVGVRDLLAVFAKSGNDSVSLDGGGARLQVQTRGGDDNVELTRPSDNPEQLGLAEANRIATGPGNDTVQVLGADSELRGEIQLDLGGDSDQLSIRNMTFFGRLGVQLAGGSDHVSLADCSFYSEFDVDLGPGSDTTHLNNLRFFWNPDAILHPAEPIPPPPYIYHPFGIRLVGGPGRTEDADVEFAGDFVVILGIWKDDLDDPYDVPEYVPDFDGERTFAMDNVGDLEALISYFSRLDTLLDLRNLRYSFVT